MISFGKSGCLALAIVILLLLSACGGNKIDPNRNSNAPVETVQPDHTQDANGTDEYAEQNSSQEQNNLIADGNSNRSDTMLPEDVLPDEEGSNDSSVSGDNVGDTNSGSSDVASDSLSDGGTENESGNSKSGNVIELPLVPLP